MIVLSFFAMIFIAGILYRYRSSVGRLIPGGVNTQALQDYLLLMLIRSPMMIINIIGLVILFIAFHWALPELSSAWWKSSMSRVAILLVIGMSVLYWSDGDPNKSRKWIVRGMTAVFILGVIWTVFGIKIDPREPAEPAKVQVTNSWFGW